MPVGGGGTSTSTSVFNMVLNTVGASGFASALTSAQNGINGVVSSLNKAGTAAATGRVNSELQAASLEKMTTSLARAAASLDIFKTKIIEHSQALQDNRDRSATLQIEIAELTDRLSAQQSIMSALDPTSRGYAGRLAQITEAIQTTKSKLAGYLTELTEVNDAVEKGTQKEKLYDAQLAAREARINASKVAMEQVKAPLTGFESFLATLIQIYNTVDKVTRTIDRMTLTIERVERIWLKFREIVSGVTGGAIGGSEGGGEGGPLGSLASAAIAPTQMLGQVVGDVAGQFSILGQAVAAAIGQGFVDMVEGAINLVGQLAQQLIAIGKTAFDASGTAERFIISLRSMIGVERAGADSTLDLKDAIKQSAQEAADLYKWAIKLGVLSPFTIAAAKDSLQLGLAYQFTTKQAVDLTQATFDWGAATGKSTDQVTSVVRMLGQMNTLGKFSGRILLELGTAGIGLNTVLQEMSKQTGIEVDKLKEMEAQGEITGEMGINAILGFMHKFDGAAKEQAGTIQGLIESLQEMGPELLKDFFGPLDVISGKIGGVIGVIQKRLQGVVGFLQSDWIPGLLTSLGQGFGDLAEGAFTWGENLVNQFANGMLAAIGSILSALTSISNYIAFWLQPGSPPKILPDIGEWGKSAINEFFKGFSQGDMSLFSSIGDTIEKHLRAVLVKEPTDKIGILNNIFGERQAVAEAVAEFDKTGNVVEATFQRVFAAMGGATSETQAYIRTSVALETQNKKVTVAQQALDNVTKKYNDLLKPLQDDLQGITDAQSDLAAEQQKTMLELVLKDPNATLAEKQRAKLAIDQLSAEEKQRALVAEAKKEVDTAQAKVDAETAKQTALENTLALQKSILAAEDDQVALMQEYYDLMKQIANTASAAAGGGGGGANQLDPSKLPDMSKFVGPKLGHITDPQWITDLKKQLAEAWAAIQNAFKNIESTIKPVTEAFHRMGDAIGALWQDFLKYGPMIELYIAQLTAWTISRFSKEMPGAINDLTTAVENLQGIWDKNHLIMFAIAAFVWQKIFEFIMANVIAFAVLTKLVTGALNFDWVDAFNNAKDTVGGFLDFLQVIWDSISLIFAGTLNIIAGYLVGFLTGDWTLFWKGMLQYATGWLGLIGVAWRVATGVINTIIKGFVGDMLGKWDSFLSDLHWKIWKFQFDAKQAWFDFQQAIKQFVTEWIPELVKTWESVWKGIKDESAAEILLAIDQFVGFMTNGKKTISDEVTNFQDLGTAIIQGIINGAASMAQALIDAVVGPVKNAIEAARRLLNINSPSRLTRDLIGKPMAEGIVAGIVGQGRNIQGAMTDVLSGSVNMVGGGAALGMGGSYSTSRTTNFNYNPTYNSTPGPVSDNFALMQAMVV